ncbi:hypothetical protein P3S68_021559 [Capsicum galapagoense]
MLLQNHLGHQTYSHEQNYYSDSSHGQMMRPSAYSSTIPFSHSTQNNHMMTGQHHGGHYGNHGHSHSHYGSQGSYQGHMPHDSTNFSSSTTNMVHSDGYGSGMQQSSHAHMSSVATGHHGHGHGHGYGGSHQNSYCQSQKFNWALKNLDD